MSRVAVQRLLLITTMIMVSMALQAAPGRGAFQSTKVGVLMQDYSGTANKSFAQGSPGYGFELTADAGNIYLRYFFRTRFTVAEGKQNFSDEGILFSSTYKYIQFAPEIGISLYPVSRKSKGVNVYLWGAGGISYNNLELNTLLPKSTIRSKDQSFGYGYGAGVGFELILGSGAYGNYYLLYGEAGFREARTDLTNYNQFEVGGATYSLGLGF